MCVCVREREREERRGEGEEERRNFPVMCTFKKGKAKQFFECGKGVNRIRGKGSRRESGEGERKRERKREYTGSSDIFVIV